MTGKTLYYPVYIAPGRKTGGWTWGRPHDDLVEAAKWLAKEMASIGSPLGTLVEFSNGEKIPLAEHTQPKKAREVILRWEELMETTEE